LCILSERKSLEEMNIEEIREYCLATPRSAKISLSTTQPWSFK
jgi:hypothetical protein